MRQTREQQGKRWRRANWLFLASILAVIPTLALSTEVLVTPSEIVDMEFDWGRDGVFCADCNRGAGNARFTFTNRQYELWVGGIDPASGAFVPPNGRGSLVDVDAAFATDFGNGPEWMLSAQGSEIAYTKYLAGQPHNLQNAGVGLATLTAGGWSAGFITGGAQRAQPFGSLDLGDPQPRLDYKIANDDVLWRYAADPASEEIIPRMDELGASRRWVPGRRAIVFVAHADPQGGGPGLQQIFMYDVVTRQLSQLTTDSKTKWGVFMWRAPEFNDEYVFVALVNRTRLVVYRQLPNPRGVLKWTAITSVAAPSAFRYIWSPEPFVYNGRSYISMQVSNSANATNFKAPSHIAVTGIDPANPGFRMLTNTSNPSRLRLDPEYYITAQGPQIYYNRYLPATATTPLPQNEGVWRVDTGLGPPTGP